MADSMPPPRQLDEAKVRNLWNRNAASWTAGVSRRWDFFRWVFHDPVFIPLLGEVAGLRAIDLGCGEGILSRAMAAAGARVTGVDISDEMITHALLATPGTLGITYLRSSISNLSALSDGEFDLAACAMTLMDTPFLEPIFCEAKRVLKSGGRFVFSVTHPFWDKEGTEWICEQHQQAVIRIGDYFGRTPWIDEWSFRAPPGEAPQPEPFRIATFPHQMSDYFNAAARAGLRLDEVVEPQPPKQVNSEVDSVLDRWRRVPFYLMAKFQA